MSVHSVQLSQLLQGKQLTEGANEVTKSESGFTVSALVQKGQITGWRVTNAERKEVPHSEVVTRSETGPRQCKVTVCVPIEGGRECWDVYVDCDKIIVIIIR